MITRTMQAGIYLHYKGGYYQVLGVAADATNEATLRYGMKGELMEGQDRVEDRLMVVYISLTGIELPGPRMRVRYLQEFMAPVLWPNGVTRPRFIYMGDTLR